jgi:phospholipase/carboxylesterase
MNRIKISPLAAIEPQASTEKLDDPEQLNVPATPQPIDCFENLAFGATDDLSVFLPMHYEKKYAYPLIVWLHGDGESSDQIQRVMPSISMQNFVGIAPAAPTVDREQNQLWLQDPGLIEEAHESVVQAIDYAASRFNIAPQRIFLAGAEQGATMAFRLAFQRPDLFAGVISLNGPLPTRQSVLGDWARCRDLPVFWAHCRDSADFEQDTLCEQLKLLHVAGFSVTLRQYPGFKMMSDKMLSDCNGWIMESIESVIS